jgi:alpha-ketoglutarate-dependent taurine dioxygenase
MDSQQHKSHSNHSFAAKILDELGAENLNYEIAPLSAQQALPLVIESRKKASIHTLDENVKALAVSAIEKCGGVLFRNFALPTPVDFKRFAASFGKPLASYEFGSTPRSKVFSGVYSSTEYPPHQHIPLHNEQSYTCQWPERIWLHCITPSETGGETPITDSRAIFQAIDPAIRDEFIAKGLLYVRNYSDALDLPWQQVFNTQDKSKAEQYCREQGIAWQWKNDGELVTKQHCQSAIAHPITGEWVWFNQAHLFHISAVPAELRATLLASVGEKNLPRNVYFGDGSKIEDAMLDEIRAVYDRHTVAFPWRSGDVIMLDNILAAHGRKPYTGKRKVIVAMA